MVSKPDTKQYNLKTVMYKQTVQLEIISVNQTKTKIELVISQIEQQIKNRSLTPGTRLPSVRKLAKDLGFLFLLLSKLMSD